MKELVDHMNDYSRSALVPHNRKIFMYSAHDATVGTVLLSLNVFNNIRPPYGAMVLVELHEINPQELFVKVNQSILAAF